MFAISYWWTENNLWARGKHIQEYISSIYSNLLDNTGNPVLIVQLQVMATYSFLYGTVYSCIHALASVGRVLCVVRIYMEYAVCVQSLAYHSSADHTSRAYSWCAALLYTVYCYGCMMMHHVRICSYVELFWVDCAKDSVPVWTQISYMQILRRYTKRIYYINSNSDDITMYIYLQTIYCGCLVQRTFTNEVYMASVAFPEMWVKSIQL